jgi:hypothetical protein
LNRELLRSAHLSHQRGSPLVERLDEHGSVRAGLWRRAQLEPALRVGLP